jgi:thermitase
MSTEILVKVKAGVTRAALIQKFGLESLSKPSLERLNPIPVGGGLENAVPLFATDQEREDYIEENILPNLSEVEQGIYRIFKFDISAEADSQKIIKSLESTDGIEYVQVNEKNDLMFIPGDPLMPQLYALTKMECQRAWPLASGENVIVAVVDTGVDYDHPDLSANMWRDINGNCGYNFSEDNSDPKDYHSHGTHVAGTIAASSNGLGIIGVAFNAKIMALKAFPRANDSDFHRAIKFAADNGARVINNSWGPTRRRPRNPVVEDAIDYAVEKGVCVIFAAGNSDDDVVHYSPANYSKVIAVSATDENDNKAGFSNYGSLVSVSAPGKNILSCKFNTDSFAIKSGTSMAAPHVAGLAALILSSKPDVTLASLISTIKSTVDEINSTVPMGSGRVNAFKAIS